MSKTANRQLLNEFEKLRVQHSVSVHLNGGEQTPVRINYDDKLGVRLVGNIADLTPFMDGQKFMKLQKGRLTYLVTDYHFSSACDRATDNCIFHIERISFKIPKPRAKNWFKVLVPDIDHFTMLCLQNNLATNLKSNHLDIISIEGIDFNCQLVNKGQATHLIITCHQPLPYQHLRVKIYSLLASLGFWSGGYYRNWFCYFYDNDAFDSIAAYTYDRSGANVIFPFCALQCFTDDFNQSPNKFSSKHVAWLAQRLLDVPGFYDKVSLWLELGMSTPRQQIMVMGSVINFLCKVAMGKYALVASPLHSKKLEQRVREALNRAIEALAELDPQQRASIKRNLQEFNRASFFDNVTTCFKLLKLELEDSHLEAVKKADPVLLSTATPPIQQYDYLAAGHTALRLANIANMILLRLAGYNGAVVDFTLQSIPAKDGQQEPIFTLIV